MRRVALTFDDGPNGRYTLGILDILKKHKLKAAFFLLGENVEYYPDIAKRIKREGHLIGNHTYSHKHLKRLRADGIRAQIESAEEVYKRVLNMRPKFFRAPYCEHTGDVRRIAKGKGYELIGWGAHTEDWKIASAGLIAAGIISKVKDGSVILLHDGANIRHGNSRVHTVNALELIIEVLRQDGFRIIRLDRLLRSKRCQR